MKKILFSTAFIVFAFTNCKGQFNDTVITELNPSNFNQDFSKYDQSTALFCAQLSDVSYDKPEKISLLEKKIQNQYPNEKINILVIDDKSSHSRAMFFGTQKFIVVAFRGTEFSMIKDLITDVKIFRYINTSTSDEHYGHLPGGHGGFRRGIMNLIDNEDIFSKLKNFVLLYSDNINWNHFPIYVTGHSLGAALASMFILPLSSKEFNFIGAYNFAPPLAVRCSDATEIHDRFGSTIYDIVNYVDYVPRAGETSRNHLRHIGKFYRICKNGQINNEDEQYIAFLPEEHNLATLKKYHQIKGYKDNIRNSINTNKKIADRKSNNERCFDQYIPIKCTD